MSTEFYNRNWRMANSFNGTEDNNSKFSNYSMSFDGSEYIDTTTNLNSLGVTSSFSVSYWVNISNNVQYDNIISGPTSLNVWTSGFGFYLTGTEVIFWVDHYIGANQHITSAALNNNEWYHITGTFDTTNGLKLYVNAGTPLTATGTVIDGLTNNIYIGSSGNASTRSFNGQIDHCSIFDYALTQAQVTALYGSSSTGVGNPMAITNGRKPVAYYPIGDYSAYNGTEYLVPNSAVSDYVFQSDGSLGPVINLPSINLGTTNTISFWYYNEAWDTSQIPIGSSTNQFDYLVAISTSYSITVNRIYYAIGNPQIYLDFNNTDARNILNNTNTWIHIAITRNGDSVSLYLNGSFNETLTGVGTTNDTILDTLISEADGVGSNSINGKMSNVSVLNTELPATGTESIASLYNYGTPPDISSYSGLQGFWKLDASATFSGNWSIPDDSSNSNTGTSSGMTATNLVQSNLNILSPYSRYALSFDGTNDYITVPSTSDFAFGTNGYSISFWFNGSGTNNSSGFGVNVFDMRAAVTFAAPSLWIQTKGANSLVKLYINGAYLVSTTATINSDEWYHILVTNDGTTSKIFLNGNTTPIGTGADSTNYVAAPLKIGRYYQNNTYNYSGLVSNLSIWNASLTSAQVTEIYNNGLPSNLNNHSAYSNLISWWQLGENMSYDSNVWTVIDEKGTNNGTGANLAPAEDSIVNGIGTSGNGLSSGMGGADNIIGEAPYSTANAVSYGMGVDARVSGSGNVPS